MAVDLHPHWSQVAVPVLSLLGAIAIGVAAPVLSSPGTWWRTVLGWSALAAIAAASVWTLARYAAWSSTRLIVTNQRVIHTEGWLRRRGVDIPLDRIVNVGTSQRIRDRLVGVGDLIIDTAGESGPHRFTAISRPARVQNRIYAQMRIDRDDGGIPAADRAREGLDLASQLERLEGLVDRGVLTPEEFEIQKRRLLRD